MARIMQRGALRTDKNHVQIANAFRAFGAKVITLHHAGHGLPDLLVVMRGGDSCFVEVKTEKGKLKREQAEFIVEVRNSVIIRSVDDVEMFFRDFHTLRMASVKEAQALLK